MLFKKTKILLAVFALSSSEAFVVVVVPQVRARSRLRAARDEVSSALDALDKEIEAKRRLEVSLMRELDSALGEAMQAEALARGAKADEESARAKASGAMKEAEAKAARAAEETIRPAKAVLLAAEAEEAAAREATQAQVRDVTKRDREQWAVADSRAKRDRAEIEEVKSNRSAEIAEVETRASAEISGLLEALAESNKEKGKNTDSFGLSVGFAGIAGAAFASHQLRLPFLVSGLGGLACVALFLVFGTTTFTRD